MPDKLSVYWESRFVGTLELDGVRQFSFRYAPSWISDPEGHPISLSLPLQIEAFGHAVAFPFFSNLLPEDVVRKLIARDLGISEQNDFKLLEALGGDCAGALSLLRSDQKPGAAGSYVPLSLEKLNQILLELPERPLLSPHDGVRLSLAGAQDKLPVYRDDTGNFFLPRGINPSSHILKPPISRVKCSVENEVFVMTIANELKMRVPEAHVWKGVLPVFITKRYDRKRTEDGRLVRLHQEDFCQALSFGAGQKYEKEGGPSLKVCFQLLERHASEPALQKQRLVQWIIFNTIVGNNDAHAKNISLLWSESKIGLAPFYDLLSTAVYPSLSQKMAMYIGGEDRAEWLRRDHWEALAKDAGIASSAVFRLMGQLLETVPRAVNAAAELMVKEPGDFSILTPIQDHIKKSLIRLKKTMGTESR